MVSGHRREEILNILRTKGPMFLDDLARELGLSVKTTQVYCAQIDDVVIKRLRLPLRRGNDDKEYRSRIRRLARKKIVFLRGDDRIYSFLAKQILLHDLIPYSTADAMTLATTIDNAFVGEYSRVKEELAKVIAEAAKNGYEIRTTVYWIQKIIYKLISKGYIDPSAVWLCPEGNLCRTLMIVNPKDRDLKGCKPPGSRRRM